MNNEYKSMVFTILSANARMVRKIVKTYLCFHNIRIRLQMHSSMLRFYYIYMYTHSCSC